MRCCPLSRCKPSAPPKFSVLDAYNVLLEAADEHAEVSRLSQELFLCAFLNSPTSLADSTLSNSLAMSSLAMLYIRKLQAASGQECNAVLMRTFETDIVKFPHWMKHGSTPLQHRPCWLDAVPPFDGNFVATPAQASILRRLQCLLLCEQLDSTHVADELLRGLNFDVVNCDVWDSLEIFPGFISLLLVLLPREHRIADAVQLAMGACPSVIVPMVATSCKHAEDWAAVLNMLHNVMQQTEQCRGGQGTAVGDRLCLVHDLLTQLLHMCVLQYDYPQFVSLLPASGRLDFYLPFIHRSLRLARLRALEAVAEPLLGSLQ